MQLPLLYGNPNDSNTGNRQNIYNHVRNDDSTTLLRGAPCCFVMDGVRDGFDVVQAATSGANKSTAYFAGIVAKDIPAGEMGMALISGVADFVRCSGSVAVETSLSVNPAAANFVGGATQATIIAVTSIGPGVFGGLVNAVATATVDGVSNVSARVMVRGL